MVRQVMGQPGVPAEMSAPGKQGGPGWACDSGTRVQDTGAVKDEAVR